MEQRRVAVAVCLTFICWFASTTCTGAQAEKCPLQLHNYTYRSSCFDDTGEQYEAFNQKFSGCCVDILRDLSKSLASYVNSSSGHLFLPFDQQQACIHEVVNGSNCNSTAGKLAAGLSPCAFANVSDLQNALNGSNNTYQTVSNSCSDLPDYSRCLKCFNSFTSAVLYLANKQKDALYVCAGALLVSLVSARPHDDEWIRTLYDCIDTSKPVQDSGFSSSKKLIFLIVGSLLGGLLIVGGLIYACIRRVRRSHQHHGDDDQQDLFPDDEKLGQTPATREGMEAVRPSEGLYTFAAKEILKATNNLSEENFIGEGSAGKVYKGALPSGQLVAVKQIDKKLDTFVRELDNLSRVRHPHLVTLLGYSNFGEQHYLVYEYCSKGNLSQWLFRDEGPILTWPQRLIIAVNSARGLWFLHNYPGGSIIHRDVKPTNILLNEHLEAKLSDFGLSKFIAIEESRVFTEVKGTAGYLDPEYISNGQLTLASDVYSFGIVLLQLISGRRAIDFNPAHRHSLVKTAKLLVKEDDDIYQLVDPRLNGVYCGPAFETVLHVAVLCTAESRAERLNMSEILQYLEDAWKVTEHAIASDPDSKHSKQEEQSFFMGSPNITFTSRETPSMISYPVSDTLIPYVYDT